MSTRVPVRTGALASQMPVMTYRTSKRAASAVASETSDVIAWRKRRLEHAGFDEARAAEFATDRRVDIHALLELVDRGCPPRLAGRILAPLDVDDRKTP